MKPEINVSVDEFTIVLHPEDEFTLKKWVLNATQMIHSFEEKSGIIHLFGKRNILERPPQGYKTAYTYGEHPFYFAIGFHESYVKMGVIIKFSALAWSFYQTFYLNRFEQEIHVFQFVQNIQCEDLYTVRLSRFDLAIDYLNFDIEVDSLYKDLTSEPKLMVIKNINNRINNSVISGMVANNVSNTMYIGSRKRNVNILLRVYDKKIEQIETNGYFLKEALAYQSWIRFEVVFKGKYAHQITDSLMDITKFELYQNYLINLFLEKYQFYQVNNDELILHPISDILFKALKSETLDQTLYSPRPINNDLVSSLLYIIKGSGLFPILYKVEQIWGDDQIELLFEFIYYIYKSRFNPNNDHRAWLEKNNKTLKTVPFEEILELVNKLIDRRNK
ncbi:hypothetical protein CYJ57_01575 [Falseniella ignava]|uniref:Replication initiation protein-like C-terminal domain-containing protein n=1 Tax=Falseniella ignava TaxID=137730 RepID=A0A2I1K4K2_9LACT|nr:replication initiation factor domain-containing protein [Falseniella ignava]PKY90578.1 hypothetical protein CYJ57_01575 [Falseniella ignava]